MKAYLRLATIFLLPLRVPLVACTLDRGGTGPDDEEEPSGSPPATPLFIKVFMGLEGAVRGAKRFLKGAALASSVYLSGCTKIVEPPVNDDEETQVEQSYINFHAYWAGASEHPAVVNVYLYQNNKSQRLLAGGTNPNGDFYSLTEYPVDKVYQIFIQDIGTRQCLDEVLVNFNSWPKSDRDEIEKRVNVGPRNPLRNIEGCRF